MCTTNKSDEVEEESTESSESDDMSNATISDSEVSEENDDQTQNQDQDEEEEDEVIKAIRNASEKKRDHPPVIHCEDFITDISFHPHEDFLAVANIVGDVTFYKYTNEETTVVRTLELHTKSCRDIEFSGDGKILYSVAKDKTIMLSDVESGKLVRFFDEAHEVPIYCLLVIDENLFATGDDEGCVKLWDLRQNVPNPIYKTKKNEDYISDLITHDSKNYLLCSSGDGSLTTIDLRNRTVHMQSEEYEEELTCLGLFRSESKLVAEPHIYSLIDIWGLWDSMIYLSKM
ncbi:WD40 domain containing protein [Asbolus verrucosus]|uniref:WD repeat-containing protein 55 homolog n=1 Tax=Asbolus verrucosus TaxID=1661398 RepID=A0A482W6V4_ASBVE|nr:WD40 domain containing protein [Asbolus verrucosus]